MVETGREEYAGDGQSASRPFSLSQKGKRSCEGAEKKKREERERAER